MTNESQLSKKERQALKQEEKRRARAAQATAARRSRLLQWAGGVLVVALAIGALVWASGSGSGAGDGYAWYKGNEDAPVALVEYSDFQCPACGSYYPLVKQLHEEFGGNLKIVYRHYPLTSIHPYAETAARAAEAAGRQGKFWEMHDLLFENQRSWANATVAQVQETFTGYAETLGLDSAQFQADMNSNEVSDAINADRIAGNRAGVRGTPTFVLQGETLDNPSSYEQFRSLVAAAFEDAGADPNSAAADGNVVATTTEAVHKHADIAVYIREQQLDLSQDKYQSHGHDGGTDDHADNENGISESEEAGGDKHPYLHLHDTNGDVIHAHANGYTLADFFQSIGITLTNECLKLDTGEEYCANELETLTGMVNGERVADIAGYEFNDEDRILISFGNERALDEEMASVTHDACIYSETCPERGAPPDETCVGGIGTNCEE